MRGKEGEMLTRGIFSQYKGEMLYEGKLATSKIFTPGGWKENLHPPNLISGYAPDVNDKVYCYNYLPPHRVLE